MVQEALSNVRKHAGASRVLLEVSKGAAWRFLVRDNGQGFDATRNHGQSHVGMKIMRERASRIGAVVEVVSTAGEGTTVMLTLPPHPVAGTVAAGRPHEHDEVPYRGNPDEPEGVRA